VKRIRIVVDEFLDRFVVFGWGLSAPVETEKSSRPLDVFRDRMLRVRQYTLRQRANENAGQSVSARWSRRLCWWSGHHDVHGKRIQFNSILWMPLAPCDITSIYGSLGDVLIRLTL